MPLYEFECVKCGAVFEKIVAMANRDTPCKCEDCGALLTRIISGGKFMLIGGGWSGNAHPIVIPPKTDPNAYKGYHNNYSNVEPEKVQHLVDADPGY